MITSIMESGSRFRRREGAVSPHYWLLLILLTASSVVSAGPVLFVDQAEEVVDVPAGTVVTNVFEFDNRGDAALTWKLTDLVQGKVIRSFSSPWPSATSMRYDVTRDCLWLSWYNDPISRLYKVSTVDGSVLDTNKVLGANCKFPYAVEMENGYLWASDSIGKQIRKFDLDTMGVVSNVSFPGGMGVLYSLAIGGGNWYVAGSMDVTDIYRLDPATGAILQTYDGIEYFYATMLHIGYGAGGVWYGGYYNPRNEIRKFDPALGWIRRAIQMSDWYTSCRIYDQSFVGTNMQVWALTYEHDYHVTGRSNTRIHLLDVGAISRLSESADSGTVASNSTGTIDVMFDGRGLSNGIYRAGMRITSADGSTGTKPYAFVVHAPGANIAPVANAGVDQVVPATGAVTHVTLDGSGSSDPNGDELTYLWTMNTSSGEIAVATSAGCSVLLPPGVSDLTLTVKDLRGGVGTDTVRTTITAPNIAVENVVVPVLQGMIATGTVTLVNTGEFPLTWKVAEALPLTQTNVIREYEVTWKSTAGSYALATTMRYDPTRDCLWVAYQYDGEIGKLNPINGAELARYDLGDTAKNCAMDMEGSDLWIADFYVTSGQIKRYNPDTWANTATLSRPAGWPTTSPAAIVRDAGQFFAVKYNAANIYRLNPTTGAEEATLVTTDSFGLSGNKLEARDGVVWYAPGAPPRNVIKRMDGTSGAMLGMLRMDAWSTNGYIYDQSLTATNTQLWVLTSDVKGDGKRRAHLLDVSILNRFTKSVSGGTLTVGATNTFVVTLNTAGLPVGTYPVGLQFASNDPDAPVIERQVMVAVHAAGENHPPVANAGPDRTEKAWGATVPLIMDLSGAGSYDPDGDPLRKTWTWKDTGAPVALGTGGLVEFRAGTNRLTLTVDDYRGGTNTDDLVVTVIRDSKGWRGWHGTKGDGQASETNLNWIQNWPPVTTWKTPGGGGNTSIIMSDGFVFTGWPVQCIDALTGVIRWTTTFGARSVTPCVDEERVYSLNSPAEKGTYDVEVRCWDKFTGAVLWTNSVSYYIPGTDGGGNYCSPTVYGDLLLIQGYALNKRTGALVWRKTVNGTGTVHMKWFDWNGRTLILDANQSYFMDPLTGANTSILSGGNASNGESWYRSRVTYGTNRIWTIKSMLPIGGSSTVWQNPNLGVVTYTQPITLGTHGYYVTGGHGCGGAVNCVNLDTGAKVWTTGFGTGPVIGVGDKVVGQSGPTINIMNAQCGGTPVFTHQYCGIGDLQYAEMTYDNSRFVLCGDGNYICLFTGLSAPVVTHGAGAVIDDANGTATMNGVLENEGNGGEVNTGRPRPRVFLHWGSTDGGTNPLAWDHTVDLGSRTRGPFALTTAVERASVCYYRCFASNDVGATWASATTRFSTYASGSPLNDSTLLAHWTLDDLVNGVTAVDSSGNGNHATISGSYGMTTFSITNQGAVGAALWCDAARWLVRWTYLTSPTLSEPIAGDFTFSYWVNLLAYVGDNNPLANFLIFNPGGLEMGFRYGNNLSADYRLWSGAMETGRWYNVAITRTGGTNYTTYVNGVQALSPFSRTSTETFTSLKFSMDRPSMLDDIRLYRRVLSQEELSGLVALGCQTNNGLLTTNVVTVGADDAEERQDGVMNLGRTDLYLGRGPGTDGYQKVGLRFPNAGIPRGASILSASIRFRSSSSLSEESWLVVQGEDADDAASFGSGISNISSRALTDVALEWHAPAWSAGASGAAQETPDLSGVVQSLVNREGWTTNSAMAFVISGSGQRMADAFEKVGGTGAMLKVTWALRGSALELLTASSLGNTNEVVVRFDRRVAPSTAEVPGNYQLSEGIAVLGASVIGDGKSVRLTTSGMTTGTTYLLTVDGVTDVQTPANSVAPGATVSFICRASPVQFVRKDTLTSGNWPWVYGSDGRKVGIYSSSLPIYADLEYSLQYYHIYSSTEPRALLRNATSTDREMECWRQTASSFTITVNITDGAMHQVAFYCVDWDMIGRGQRVEVVDPGSGTVWDTQTLATNSFTNGVWLVWNVSGRQSFRFSDLAGGQSAIANGVFFDPPFAMPSVATPPTITSTAPTNGIVGLGYTYNVTTLGVPETVLIVSGVPGWLTLSESRLSGTPPAAGSYRPITIVASNGVSPNATQMFSIVVADIGLAAPGFASVAPKYGTVGAAYSYAVVVTGTPAATVTVSGKPGWMTWASSTLAGKPVAAGTYGPITLVASNGVNPTATQTFSVVVTGISSNDWEQFRGPNRDGVSTSTPDVSGWPPQELWTRTIEKGESSVVINDGRLYTMGRNGANNIVYCLDASTGTNLWTHVYASGAGRGSYGPLATPTVAGNEVYTFDDTGMLYCLNKVTGAVLWNLQAGLNKPTYGYAGSPLVDGDLIIFNGSGIGGAVSRTTHQVVWPRGVAPAGGAYASPKAVSVAGQRMILYQADATLKALNPTDGSELWSYSYDPSYENGADPLVYGDKVFLFEHGATLLNAADGTEVWKNCAVQGALYTTPVILGAYVYGIDCDGSLVRVALLDGTTDWNTAVSETTQGAVIAADGKLIVLADGKLRIVDIAGDGFDEGAREPVTVSGTVGSFGWTPPAVCGNKVYCRIGTTLKCYRLAPPNQAPSCGITAPTNGMVYSAPASIAINAGASDADGSVVKVEFYNGTTKIGEDFTAPYDCSWTGVAAGSYSLTVKATDNEGAIATSLVVNVTVAESVGYRVPIVFGGYNRGETLTNFPALVKLGTNLTGFAYNQFVSAQGWDLRFLAADGVTELPYEIEKWDVTGVSYVWVRVPLLTNNASMTAIWGDPFKAFQQTYTTNGAVWVNGYRGVWHMSEAGTGTRYDSSSNRIAAASSGSPAQTDGRVGKAVALVGSSSQYLATSSATALNNWTEQTWSLWIRYSGGMVQYARLLEKGANNEITLAFNFTGDNNKITIQDLGTYNHGFTTVSAYNDNQWHHVVLTVSNNYYVTLSIDNANVGSKICSAPPAKTGHLFFGNYGGGGPYYYNGAMDEVRISSVVRSANWIWAEWMNMASNSSFNSYGAITVTIPSDANGNGILDAWETTYFGTTANTLEWYQTHDSDCDGMSDWAEYVAGTNPKNASSCLWAAGAGFLGTAGVVIQWSSQANRLYHVCRTTNLMDGFSVRVATDLPATPPMNVYTDRTANGSSLFYRIEVK